MVRDEGSGSETTRSQVDRILLPQHVRWLARRLDPFGSAAAVGTDLATTQGVSSLPARIRAKLRDPEGFDLRFVPCVPCVGAVRAGPKGDT